MSPSEGNEYAITGERKAPTGREVARALVAPTGQEPPLPNAHALSLFVKHSPAAVAMFDTNMCYLVASDRWFEDYKLEVQDIIGRSHYEVFPDIPDRWKEEHQRCLRGASVHGDEDCFPRADGTLDWVRREIHPWRTHEGKIGGIIIFNEVITARKKVEEALRESEARFRLLAESASDLVCLHEPDGRYAYVSPSAKRLLGYEPEDLLGRDPYELFHPDDIDRIREESHEKVLRGDAPLTIRYRLRCRTGEYRWLETKTTPITDDAGTIVKLQTASRDVTANELTRQALERSNRDLQEFAYVASHDLQEPLRMVASYLQLLEARHREKLDEEAKEFIAYAVDGAQRMKQLINDLLAYARVTTRSQPLKPIDSEAVLQKALANLALNIEETSAIIEHEPLPMVPADEVQLLQLFQNLIGNALKFRKENAPRIRISAVEEGEAWRFSVEDNGIGIDPAYTERIFTIFQRLNGREEYPGTGIGLAVCRRIVERHGGRIWVESDGSTGSVFHFALPKEEGTREP